jgi:hypothetical protein
MGARRMNENMQSQEMLFLREVLREKLPVLRMPLLSVRFP